MGGVGWPSALLGVWQPILSPGVLCSPCLIFVPSWRSLAASDRKARSFPAVCTCLLLAGRGPLPRSVGAADAAAIAQLQREPSAEQRRWLVTCCASPACVHPAQCPSFLPSVRHSCPASVIPAPCWWDPIADGRVLLGPWLPRPVPGQPGEERAALTFGFTPLVQIPAPTGQAA